MFFSGQFPFFCDVPVQKGRVPGSFLDTEYLLHAILR